MIRPLPRGWRLGFLAGALGLAGAGRLAAAAEPGLLFYLSGEHGTTADFSAGRQPAPNFDTQVSGIPDGFAGRALRCGDTAALSYWAPGNVFAQRGTLSFFWRPHTPVGPTAFPIFRVGYAEHSSWDMVFLRIDYNGHGFDAFVTDASLARTRVSVTVDPMPRPDTWMHLALAWDETRGVRFYVNGVLAAEKEAVAVYNAALDQFGPNARIISPWNVSSAFNYVRGGDLDELRIYDRMVPDAAVARLAAGGPAGLAEELPGRSLAAVAAQAEWAHRYGWDTGLPAPPYLDGPEVTVRKVEIHDAYDFKRWWWKATDGIRETTWPGVYNRSRLPGRNDYFQLPDWDCYSLSGKSITFFLPDEPWNHLEISGAAWGTVAQTGRGAADRVLFERPAHAERTIHRLDKPITGTKVRFDNVEQEQPIGEFDAYYVHPGREPAAAREVAYRVGPAGAADPQLDELTRFIAGRYPADERSILIAAPDQGSPSPPAPLAAGPTLPLVHLLIPLHLPAAGYQLDAGTDGLDGVVLELPGLAVRPTHGGLFPLNLQVKDPLWPLRNLCNFTFSVKPGEPRRLWVDLRDRLLPPGKSLYLTLAGAGADFTPAALAGLRVRLVFKPRAAARAEHELDRFTQVKDEYAMLVEEHPSGDRLHLWSRFAGDIQDLMRANPDHVPGRNYYAVAFPGTPWPAVRLPAAPAGVPLWAFRQVEALGELRTFVNWWIDHRQIENGEFGGGLSDDTDLTNQWPATGLLGLDAPKVADSLRRELDACYREGMLVGGLPTIQADELHGYEEGINSLGQNLILSYGSPRLLERARETARAVVGLTAINAAGHRLFRTAYYNNRVAATDSVWGYTKPYEYLLLQPAQLLVDFNGDPALRQWGLEMADGLLAHRRADAQGRFFLPASIHFTDDRETGPNRGYFPWPLFWSAYQWSGEAKYLAPIFDGGPSYVMRVNANLLDLLQLQGTWGPRILADEHGRELANEVTTPGGQIGRGDVGTSAAPEYFKWQLTGDRRYLVTLFERELREIELGRYINTEGSLWIDRVSVPFADLQRLRLGGVALSRNNTVPGHVVSWQFAAPATAESIALLVPHSTRTAFEVVAYNLSAAPVDATMTGWNLDPGQWSCTQTVVGDEDGRPLSAGQTGTVRLERSRGIPLRLASHATTVLQFRLVQPGTPYWSRPDLGIDPEDIVVHGRDVTVRVHSLGAVPAPATSLVFRAADGRILATERIPALPAASGGEPTVCDVRLCLPEGASAAGGRIELDPGEQLEEITRLNNQAAVRAAALPALLPDPR